MRSVIVPDSDVIARETAKILLETRSVLFNAKEPFTFTSGAKSPVYVDCRRLISFPHARSVLMDFAAGKILRECGYETFDMVAGGETAGIPFSAFIAERLELPMLYIRKKPKGFGRMAQIEGCMDEEGKNVLLVEDLLSVGTSKTLFVDALRASGAVVESIFVLFHYDIYPSSKRMLEEAGVNLVSLATWWDVLRTARSLDYFDDETLDAVEGFLKDPESFG